MMLRDYFAFVYLDNGVEYATKIARNMQQAKFYSVMGDETANISNKEQLVLCISGMMTTNKFKKTLLEFI